MAGLNATYDVVRYLSGFGIVVVFIDLNIASVSMNSKLSS